MFNRQIQEQRLKYHIEYNTSLTTHKWDSGAKMSKISENTMQYLQRKI